MNTHLLDLQGVSKHYGDHRALNNVSLKLAAGELIAVLGPNGAGKTTLISSILGLTSVNSGHISLFGERQQGMERSLPIRQQLGVMMQMGTLSANLTVAEQCDLFSSYYAQGHSAAQLLALSALEPHARQRFGRLSGGQKQRLLFALALAAKPKLLFLDEPTLGLDVEARQQLWQQIRTLKASGTAVVLTTHYLEEAEQLADRVVVLQRGRVLATGTPAELKQRIQYKVISCRSRLDLNQLLALPAVTEVTREQQLVRLHSRQVEQTLRALLAEDATLGDLEVKSAGLEQAFLQLTQDTEEQAA